MRALAVTITILAWCTGCGDVGTVNNTTFFTSHDAIAYFQSVAKAKGCDVVASSFDGSSGGRTAEAAFGISIKGDSSTRDTLMQQYKDYVESELQEAGVTINGLGVWGEVSGFYFNYHMTGVAGVFRVNSLVDMDGYIQVDVFMYEHR